MGAGSVLIHRWKKTLCQLLVEVWGMVSSHWWRCSCWVGVLCGQPVVWVVAVFENVEDKLHYRKLCECMWAAYRVGRNLLCVFRKYVKLYLSQKAGHPFPLFHYVPCQVCLGQTRMISSCIRQSHSTETQHIVQTTACFWMAVWLLKWAYLASSCGLAGHWLFLSARGSNKLSRLGG